MCLDSKTSSVSKFEGYGTQNLKGSGITYFLRVSTKISDFYVNTDTII